MDEKLTTVYKACGQIEAEIVKGRLASENIPSILKYESVGNVFGLTVDGLGQVEVQVPTKYAQQAIEILEQTLETSDGSDATGPEPNSGL